MANIYDLENSVAHMEVNANRAAAILAQDPPTFTPGQRVYKPGGNYQAWGTVVSVFWTKGSQERVVFEFDSHPGMLHIFSPQQLSIKGPDKEPCHD